MHSVDLCFFFQAEDGIRDLVRSRGLGDVYKRQGPHVFPPVPEVALACVVHRKSLPDEDPVSASRLAIVLVHLGDPPRKVIHHAICLLYTSDAADERSSVDLGGRRLIKQKKR